MRKSDANDRFVRRTAVSLAPILLWAAHFGMVYGGAHVACETVDGAIGEPLADIAVWGVTGLVVLVLVGIGLRARSLLSAGESSGDANSNDFLVHVVHALTVLSLLGVIWAGAAVNFMPTCATR